VQTFLWMEQRLWGRDGDEEEGLSLGIRNCLNLDSFFGAINQLSFSSAVLYRTRETNSQTWL
jgi:hypothetical protein